MRFFSDQKSPQSKSSAVSEDILRQFLLQTSQLNQAKDELENFEMEHSAIALVVDDIIKNQYKKEHVYVIAGTEDLRCLRDNLTAALATEGAEAFILIRPLIHAEGIYLRRDGVVKGFWFDPQGWGERYYPNRAIAQLLVANFPGMDIIVSSTQVQFQDNNRGCKEHSIFFLEYVAKNGKDLFSKLATQKVTKIEYANGVQVKVLAEDGLPVELKKYLDSNGETSNYRVLKRRYFEILGKVLAKFVVKGELDFGKIDYAVKEIQGYVQYDMPMYNKEPFYPIRVKQTDDSCQLIISFDNPDQLIFGNFLLFWNVLYPQQIVDNEAIKKIRLGNFVELDELCQARYLFADKEDGRGFNELAIDWQANTITYTANSLDGLLKRIQNFNNPGYCQEVFQQHMRQSLALKVLLSEAQEELMLTNLLNIKTGGLAITEIAGALRYLLQEKTDVYVDYPLLSYSHGEQDHFILQRLEMSDSIKDMLLIPYMLRVDHSILLSIDRVNEVIEVFDSEDHNIDPATIPLLRVLPEPYNNYVRRSGNSRYTPQADGSLCGLYTILNGINKANREEFSEQKEDLMLSKEQLRSIYRAGQNYIAHTAAPLEAALIHNRHQKMQLLDMVNKYLKKAKGTDYKSGFSSLQELSDALSIYHSPLKMRKMLQ